MGERIVVIEDEDDLRNTLIYNLEREGYIPRSAATAAEGWDIATSDPLPDLILLDLMLPDGSGVDLCRRLKAEKKTRSVPIVMVTARGEETDRVMGFQVGADDYVVKPFSVRELLLRIRAVLRRSAATPASEPDASRQAFGRLQLDPEGLRAWLDGRELELTGLESRLLMLLYHRRGRFQSRDQLLEDVWGIYAEVTSRTVDTLVKRLRQKLGPAGRYIQTRRGIGYRMVQDPADAGDD